NVKAPSRTSHRAREQASIEDDVLAGDVAGVGRAEESCGRSKFLGRAETLGRDILLARLVNHLVRLPTCLGNLPGRGAKAVGLEWARQQRIDRHVPMDGLARESRDRTRQAAAGTI